ncbi:uncharacterized protein METZ01_LOCUS183397, partial [marine metagenome]
MGDATMTRTKHLIPVFTVTFAAVLAA